MEKVKRALGFLLALTAVWAMLVITVVVTMGVPQTRQQWLLAIFVGPPLYLLGEAVFGFIFSKEHGEKISPQPFSGKRIVVALAIMLLVFGGVALVLETR